MHNSKQIKESQTNEHLPALGKAKESFFAARDLCAYARIVKGGNSIANC